MRRFRPSSRGHGGGRWRDGRPYSPPGDRHGPPAAYQQAIRPVDPVGTGAPPEGQPHVRRAFGAPVAHAAARHGWDDSAGGTDRGAVTAGCRGHLSRPEAYPRRTACRRYRRIDSARCAVWTGRGSRYRDNRGRAVLTSYRRWQMNSDSASSTEGGGAGLLFLHSAQWTNVPYGKCVKIVVAVLLAVIGYLMYRPGGGPTAPAA